MPGMPETAALTSWLSLFAVAGVVLNLGGASSGPRLVLKHFKLRARPRRDEAPLFECIGRRAGLVGYLLTLFGLNPVTTLTVTHAEVRRRSVSLFGESVEAIPLGHIASISAGTSRPIVHLFLAAFGLIAGVVGLAVSGGQVMPLVVGLAVAAGFVLFYFLAGKKFVLGFQSDGGAWVAVGFRPGVLDGVRVDLERVLAAVDVIRELLSRGGPAIELLPEEPAAEEPPSEEEEPAGVEEALEPVGAAAFPDPAAITMSAFAFGDDPPPADPEQEGRDLFMRAANLFKQGRREEAIEMWKEVIRKYPKTQAGAAAVRNLERIRGQPGAPG